MKKTLTATGINGSFSGLVEIKFNYRKEEKLVHNPSTHDEEKRTVYYNRVCGYVGDDQFQSVDFQNKELVWQYIDEIERKVGAKLHQMANVPREKTLEDMLRDKGYI